MKTILWVQNEDAMMKDTFVINNVITQASDTPEETQSFAELTKAAESLRFTPRTREILAELDGMCKSTNFSIEYDTYYIQGNLVEKDNSGRNMAYMFLTTECNSFDEALTRLRNSTASIGRHCIETDLKLAKRFVNYDSTEIEKVAVKLKKKFQHPTDKKMAIEIIFLILCLLIILTIWKLMN